MTATPKTVEIWVSYIPSGAPRNECGSNIGLGWTEEEAHANAMHWPNQVAFAQAKKETLSDGDVILDETDWSSPLSILELASHVEAYEEFGFDMFGAEHEEDAKRQHEAAMRGDWATLFEMIYRRK